MKQQVFKISSSLLVILLVLSSCQKKMLRPYDFALVSAHVYDDPTLSELPNQLRPYMNFDLSSYQDWEEMNDIEDYQITKDKKLNKILNATFKFVSKGGYYGRAYLNKHNNQIIIAHRGTNFFEEEEDDESFFSNLKTVLHTLKDVDDDLAIYRGKIPPQFRAARHFEDQVREKYSKEFKSNPSIIHTGHSLGAILAELCAINSQAKAITFESPGSLPIVKELLQTEDVNTKKFDVTIYNAAPNLINSTNHQCGEVIVLSQHEKEKKSRININFDKLSTKEHGIEEIIELFDPKTGKPKENKINNK